MVKLSASFFYCKLHYMFIPHVTPYTNRMSPRKPHVALNLPVPHHCTYTGTALLEKPHVRGVGLIERFIPWIHAVR